MSIAPSRIARFVAFAVVALGALACAAQVLPAPRSLRSGNYPLVRVDGRPVHGPSAVTEAPGSLSARSDCQDRVADGTLHITADGRSFTYRSTMRRCSGELLVTETNEGAVEWRDSALDFVINQTSGRAVFAGSWTDSTITIANFGGLLEFARK